MEYLNWNCLQNTYTLSASFSIPSTSWHIPYLCIYIYISIYREEEQIGIMSVLYRAWSSKAFKQANRVSYYFQKLFLFQVPPCSWGNGLYEHGLQVANTTYYVAVTGVTGDALAHQKAFRLCRSFSSLGTTGTKGICSECLAGEAGIPYESCSDQPAWDQTCWQTRPWKPNDKPELADLHYNQNKPEKICKKDAFHICKLGLFRNMGGSGIVLLCTMGAFPGAGGESVKAVLAI